MSLQLILKHSSVSGKAPTPAQLAEGEISVNINSDGPFLCCKDTAGEVIQLGGVTIAGTAPTALKSAFWLDNSGADPVLKVYDGTAWVTTSLTPSITAITGTDPITASTAAGTTTIGIEDASQTQKGAVELATAAETTAGTSSTLAVHPAGLKVELDKKAPLDSPVFTGDPQAPTPAAGDNDTSIATTEFVTTAIGDADIPPAVSTANTPPTPAVNGQLWWDSAAADGGKLYIYYEDADSNQWVQATPNPYDTSGAGYWSRTGTTLEPATAGDGIDIGSGNILLNSDGSAEFAAGNLEIRDVGRVTTNNYFAAFRPNDGSAVIVGGKGDISSNTVTSQIFADGSATFAGELTAVNSQFRATSVGSFAFSRDSEDYQVSMNSGAVSFSGPTSAAVQGFYKSTNTNTFAVYYDGSATFANTLTTADALGFDKKFAVSGTTGNVYVGQKSTLNDAGIVLAPEGSATFAGAVTSNTAFIADTTASVLAAQRGEIYINPAGGTNIFFFDDHATGSAVNKFKFDRNGNANFAGQVEANNFKVSTSQFQFGNMTPTRLWLNSEDAAKANGIFQVGYGNAAGTQSQITFTAEGNATFAGTVTAVVVPPSDAKFKENITDANPQLADVVALGNILKNFDWNKDAPVNDEIRAQRQLGLIAQEVQEICPSLVKEIGGNDKVIGGSDPYLGISHDALIFKLLGAITELQAEVEALKGGI